MSLFKDPETNRTIFPFTEQLLEGKIKEIDALGELTNEEELILRQYKTEYAALSKLNTECSVEQIGRTLDEVIADIEDSVVFIEKKDTINFFQFVVIKFSGLREMYEIYKNHYDKGEN